jgi:hypothetical protein
MHALFKAFCTSATLVSFPGEYPAKFAKGSRFSVLFKPATTPHHAYSDLLRGMFDRGACSHPHLAAYATAPAKGKRHVNILFQSHSKRRIL